MNSFVGRSLQLVGLTVAAATIAAASWLSVELPGTSVPQTAQTLAVLSAGIFLGARWGAAALGTYLLLGGVGLPVFAGGESGAGHLIGATSGFLAGFVAGAGFAGWWVESDRAVRLLSAFLGMLLAHVVILVPGWGRLAVSVGGSEAWRVGVAPFLSGGVVKSAVAALIAWQWSRRRTDRGV